MINGIIPAIKNTIVVINEFGIGILYRSGPHGNNKIHDKIEIIAEVIFLSIETLIFIGYSFKLIILLLCIIP